MSCSRHRPGAHQAVNIRLDEFVEVPAARLQLLPTLSSGKCRKSAFASRGKASSHAELLRAVFPSARHRVGVAGVFQPDVVARAAPPRARRGSAFSRPVAPPVSRDNQIPAPARDRRRRPARRRRVPFFVPPKERTSTPRSQVISFGAQPNDATALAKRAPSMCRASACFRAKSATASSSSGE